MRARWTDVFCSRKFHENVERHWQNMAAFQLWPAFQKVLTSSVRFILLEAAFVLHSLLLVAQFPTLLFIEARNVASLMERVVRVMASRTMLSQLGE